MNRYTTSSGLVLISIFMIWNRVFLSMGEPCLEACDFLEIITRIVDAEIYADK